MLNFFRLAADFSHLFSFVILLWSIHKKKSASGISLRTQELYALVFICRYLDLFDFYSVYNTVFKIVYLVASIGIVVLMRFVKPFSTTYEQDTKEQDNFSRFLLIVPCFVLALVFNYERELNFSWPVIQEILWTFSIYLEAVAIFPQLMVLQRTGKVENMTSNYVFTLGIYRGLYILNWIYRFLTEYYYRQWIVWISGVVQTALYIDFFVHYWRAKAAAGINADVVISGSEV